MTTIQVNGRKVAVWMAPALVAAGLTAAAAPASGALENGAPTGSLLVAPATGNTDVDEGIVLWASSACPGATHGRLTITGAGFPERSSVFATVTDADRPVSVPLGVTWNALAAILHAPVPLSGTATVRFVCSDAEERTAYGEFATAVEFTPTEQRAGTYISHELESGRPMENPADRTPPPGPTPSPTLSPTTAPGPVPTPTAGLSAAALRSPDPSPSPSPTPGAPGTSPAAPSSPAGSTDQLPGVLPEFSLDRTETLAAGMTAAAADAAAVAASGGFMMTVDSDDPILGFGTPVRASDFLLTTTQLKPVTVRDNRPGGPAWSVSAQVDHFSPDLSGRFLGWTPYLISPGAGARPGESIVSGFFGGNGLLEPRVLASADDGHPPGFATFGAALDLRMPATTPPGTYSTTLTVTAIS